MHTDVFKRHDRQTAQHGLDEDDAEALVFGREAQDGRRVDVGRHVAHGSGHVDRRVDAEPGGLAAQGVLLHALAKYEQPPVGMPRHDASPHVEHQVKPLLGHEACQNDDLSGGLRIGRIDHGAVVGKVGDDRAVPQAPAVAVASGQDDKTVVERVVPAYGAMVDPTCHGRHELTVEDVEALTALVALDDLGHTPADERQHPRDERRVGIDDDVWLLLTDYLTETADGGERSAQTRQDAARRGLHVAAHKAYPRIGLVVWPDIERLDVAERHLVAVLGQPVGLVHHDAGQSALHVNLEGEVEELHATSVVVSSVPRPSMATHDGIRIEVS